MMPLYEAKMLHLYDTRWATYERDGSSRLMTEREKAERKPPMPRYWVSEEEIDRKLEGRWDKTWFLGWRDVCRSTDARTMITTQGPRVAYGDKWLLALPSKGRSEIQALWSSFVFDFVVRQKLGGTALKFFTVKQLPIPTPEKLRGSSVTGALLFEGWSGMRVDRLNGWVSSEQTRAQLRAELDAAAFHVYELPRQDVDYVMEAFPIVKRKDIAEHGCYRTKQLILEAYDAMSAAIVLGEPYKSPWEDS